MIRRRPHEMTPSKLLPLRLPLNYILIQKVPTNGARIPTLEGQSRRHLREHLGDALVGSHRETIVHVRRRIAHRLGLVHVEDLVEILLGVHVHGVRGGGVLLVVWDEGRVAAADDDDGGIGGFESLGGQLGRERLEIGVAALQIFIS